MNCHSVTLYFRALSGHLSLLFLLILSVPLQGANISASVINSCSTSESILVEFTLSEFPELASIESDLYGEGVVPRYAIFWSFGDGNHAELLVSPFENVSSPEAVVKYKYNYQVPSSGDLEFDVRIEISGVYLPVDPGGGAPVESVKPGSVIVEESIDLSTLAGIEGSCEPSDENPSDLPPLPGRTLYPETTLLSSGEGQWVKRIRDAVPGDIFTLAIHYGFDICQTTGNTGLEIEFQKEFFSYAWSNETFNSISAGALLYNFEFPATIDSRNQMLYVTFKVKEGASVGTDYIFNIRRIYTPNDACDSTVTQNDREAIIADAFENGHDPNGKIPIAGNLPASGPVDLTYLINFYNKGFTPVEEVRIIDDLVEKLDPTTVRNVFFWTGAQPTKTDISDQTITTNRELKWNLKTTDYLPEDGLPPTAGELPTKEEWAHLSFEVSSVDGLPQEFCIPNQGEIIFFSPGGTSTFTDVVTVCKQCCSLSVLPGEVFSFENGNGLETRIIEAPNSIVSDNNSFYIADSSFERILITYQNCQRRESTNSLRCDPPKTVIICNKNLNNKCELTSIYPLPPEDDPQPLWPLVLLLLVYAAIISIFYLLASSTPTP